MASIKRTIILCVILHLYMISSAFLFQKFEYKSSEMDTPHTEKAKMSLMRDLNITKEQAEEIIDDIFTAKTEDQKMCMASVWQSFPKALWFVMTLFTTVGTGHIVPQTVAGRSFCMLSALFGIPLYALFLKCAGDLVINVLRKAIRVAERTELVDVKYMNIKIMVLAFVSMTTTILIGALGSFSFGWSYFEGIYFCFISLSTVGFGDLVPSVNDQEQLIFSVIYMFFNIIGLIIVSCFISSLVNAIEEMTLLWQSFKLGFKMKEKFGSQNEVSASECTPVSPKFGEDILLDERNRP